MGCDGGTIPRRDELVKVKKKPEAKDKDAELAFQWRCCSITQQILQKPIVMCGYGRLYNKISLIETLLNRDTLPESARHIRSLKDVKDLNLTPNPTYKPDEDKKGGSFGVGPAPYICPVIGLEMSGKFRFVALWSCGCVFSERALKEVKTTNCHKCQKQFTEDDVVILNALGDDQILMKTRMDLRRSKNKKNKEKKIEVKTEAGEGTSKNENFVEVKKEDEDVKVKQEEQNVQGVSSEKNKSLKLPTKRSTNSKISGCLEPPDKRTKKMTSDYSVAKDPNASDVYKSLFTSHKSEKEQNRAHWITYNPFYN